MTHLLHGMAMASQVELSLSSKFSLTREHPVLFFFFLRRVGHVVFQTQSLKTSPGLRTSEQVLQIGVISQTLMQKIR